MSEIPHDQLNQNLVDLLNEWKLQKVWRGTIEERKQKFMWIHEHMKILFNKPDLQLIFGEITEETERIPGSSGTSFYDPVHNLIKINGKLSVITFLHEWGHALGMSQTETVDWSWLHFKTCFPVSASRLEQSIGTMFVKKSRK